MTSPLIEMDAPDAPPRHFRVLWSIVVTLLVASSISAVVIGFGPGRSSVALSTITSSAASADAARSVTIDMTMRLEMNGQKSVVRTQLRVDNVAHRGEFSSSAIGLPADISGVYGDGKYLMRMPSEAFLRADGKPWVGAPMSLPTEKSSTPADAGRQMLTYLAGADGVVDVVGKEHVRGVATTHYRVDINTTKITDTGGQRQTTLGIPAPSEDLGPVTTKVSHADVWIDDEGRLRKQRMRFDISLKDTHMTATTTTELSHYDEPVVIELPPDDQVYLVGSIAEATALIVGLKFPIQHGS